MQTRRLHGLIDRFRQWSKTFVKPAALLREPLAATALCLLMVTSGAAQAKTVMLDKIAAFVDKDVVMNSELNARIVMAKRQLAERKINLPPADILRKQVLDQLILESIQLQMGRQAGITIDDRSLNEAMTQIAQRNKMTLAQFQDSLEADGLSFAQARKEIGREMVINRLRQRQVGHRVQVSEQDIDNFLSSPEGMAQMETQYRLAHILIATPDNPSPAQVQAAQKEAGILSKQLKAGANFQELATTYSKGPNALEGGDLGWRKADQLPTLFAEQAVKMTKGQVSEPIRSPAGFHLFKLMDTRGNEKVVQNQVHVRHILIKPTEIRSNLEAKMLAQKLYDRIASGESFTDLAKQYSNDNGSALNGGDMNWVVPQALVPEFRTIMNNIPEHTVSQPFRTTHGWHILEVLGKRTSDISTEVRRNRVRELLGNRKFEEELQVWLREIRDQAYVKIPQ